MEKNFGSFMGGNRWILRYFPKKVPFSSKFTRYFYKPTQLRTLEEIQKDIKMAFPIHPRTKSRFKQFKLYNKLKDNSHIKE